MPNGGILTVSGSIDNKTVHFSVGDTGMGIKKEDMDSIFRPLFTTKAKGTGLGLAVCKRVVTAHGGTIRFESELGVGTTFHIEFPENTSDSIESIATAETAGEIVEVN